MNAMVFENITGHKGMPWFDEYEQHNRFCKVYNDGGCYVAVPFSTSRKKKRHSLHLRIPLDDRFDQLYLEALHSNLSNSDLKEYILSKLREEYPNEWTLVDYVSGKLESCKRNLGARKKRFRRKAFLNPWNYFVTFTYDDELQNEESFRKRLRKCLSNLHTRRGWRYMGVFERAPDTGRLHFHALMYVPNGQMIGEIYEREDYSTKHHRMQITHPNKFFESSFGRNDFEELSDAKLRCGNTMQYILKYLEKTEERIVYSRGIPSEFIKEVNDNDIICEMLDFVVKFVLFNDVIDYEEDVLHIKKSTLKFNLEPLPS